MLLIFLFLLGIAGAAIHCEIIALSSSKFNNKIYATLCLLVVFLSNAWLTLADPTCTYIEQDAAAKIGKHLAQLKYNPDHLGAAKFSKKDCSYSYTYTGSEGKIEFLFSPWGDIHTWDYDAQR